MRLPDPRSEDGLTLNELLIATLIGVILSFALYGFLDTTSRSSQRTAARIDAAKLGRPVMTQIMDRLHSACVAPDIAPVQPGSNGSNLILWSQTGTAVTVTPSLYKFAYTGTASVPGKLVEYLYPATGGTAPDWTFSSTASPASGRQLLPSVQQTGSTTPIFRYYAYAADGTISTTPLSVPSSGSTGLSDADAAKVVQVTISFAVPPQVSGVTGAASFTDTALLRFTPPAADTSLQNFACG
jgi:Tfp pilus assembly protein PilW